ncbi:hypothetical protein PEC18_07335 [Paucibacter sp. O1-1]|nr:hypothetical protein [Paucibacter sp. O1-1]MDA3825683.1 hypothetical protein [Paucibacter sp. O1-1]
MTIRALLGLAVAVLLVGCASPKYNYMPSSEQISEPSVGSVVTAQVGDILVRQGTLAEQEVMHVTGDHSLGLLGAYTITSGVYAKTGEDAESNYYATTSSLTGAGRLDRSAFADPTKAVQAYKTSRKLCGISVFNASVCTAPAEYRFDKVPVASANSFQQSLIYSGKVGNRVKIGYREFSGNQARPAFNNEAEYDLSEAKVIGYKGARLEILEATNELIRFKLLANFNTK